MPQVKITASSDVVERFKRIVLAKHGKLEISAEGEEALNLYVRKYEHVLGGIYAPEKDPLTEVCGMGRSAERHDALADLRAPEVGK